MLERYLKSIIYNVDQRVKRGEERLRLTQADRYDDSLKVINIFFKKYSLLIKSTLYFRMN